MENLIYKIGWKIKELGLFIMDPSGYLKHTDNYMHVIEAVLLLLVSYCLFGMFVLSLERYLKNGPKKESEPNVLDDDVATKYSLRVVYVAPPKQENFLSKFLLELKGQEALDFLPFLKKAHEGHSWIYINGKLYYIITSKKMCNGISDVFFVQPTLS